MGAVSSTVFVPERRWSPGSLTGGWRRQGKAWFLSLFGHLNFIHNSYRNLNMFTHRSLSS